MIPFGTLLIPLDVQNDPIAGRAKRTDLVLHGLRDDP